MLHISLLKKVNIYELIIQIKAAGTQLYFCLVFLMGTILEEGVKLIN